MWGRTRRVAGVTALLAALALLAGACAGESEPQEPVAAEPEGGQAAEEIPPDAQMIEVSGAEFAFDPADFDVEAGRPVAVTFVNEGTVEHDWSLRTLDGQEVEGAQSAAGPGEQAVAVFTLEPGSYEAWCTIEGHYEAGMKGSVVAE